MKRIIPLLIISIVLLIDSVAFAQQQIVDERLEQSVNSLRNVVFIKYDNNNYNEVRKQEDSIKDYQRIIVEFGQIGAERIKQEIALMDQNQEKDDFFRLTAGSILWEIGKEKEVDAILSIWKTVDYWFFNNTVSFVARKAAATHSEKVLPMLTPLLLSNGWSVEFVWGVYGSQGFPALVDVLNSPYINYTGDDTKMKRIAEEDRIKACTAIIFLTMAQRTEALPKIRELANSRDSDIRKWTVKSLGIFGHPKDFNTLVTGLIASTSKEEQLNYLSALCEYNSTRTVPYVIPFLKSPNKKVRDEACYVLAALPTVESYDALLTYFHSSEAMKDKLIDSISVDEAILILAPALSLEDNELLNFLTTVEVQTDRSKITKLSVADYWRLSKTEKREYLNARQTAYNKWFVLQEGDKKLSHDQFVELTETWIKGHSFELGKVPFRVLLHSTTPADIPRLLEVRAAVYHRGSDECLYEAKYLDLLINNLTRSQYRKDYINPYPKSVFNLLSRK